MTLEALAPEHAAEHLVAMSADVRAAVLIDPAGGLVSASDEDSERARRLAGLAHEMVSKVDSAGREPKDVASAWEAQTLVGAVFAVRDARYTLACVSRRLALPALVVYDLRQTMLALEGSAGGVS